MFNTTFVIHEDYKESLISRLSSINTNAADNGMIFNYKIKPCEDSFIYRNYIEVAIESSYQLVAIYNRRRHLYSDINGSVIDPVPYDIKNANVDRCYLCNSVRDRNEMMIIRMNKDRCVAIGRDCFKSINYNELIFDKFHNHIKTEESFEDETTSKHGSYYSADLLYQFIETHSNMEYIGTTKARQLRTTSTLEHFKSYANYDIWNEKQHIEVPTNWLNELYQYGQNLPHNDFNTSLCQIINDIKLHNNQIHISTISLMLFFMYKHRDDDAKKNYKIVDFNNDFVNDDVVLIDIKATNLFSSFDGKQINKYTFKNDFGNYFVWYTTKNTGTLNKRYHIKTKSFSVVNYEGHKICKVKNIRGID